MSGSHLYIPRNETVQLPYFQTRIIMFSLPIPTLIFLWEIYVFPGSVCLLRCSQICGLGIYKSLTDTWMWKLGLRPRNSQKRNIYKWDFRCSVYTESLIVGINKPGTPWNTNKYTKKNYTHLLFLTEAVYCLAVNVKMRLFYSHSKLCLSGKYVIHECLLSIWPFRLFVYSSSLLNSFDSKFK